MIAPPLVSTRVEAPPVIADDIRMSEEREGAVLSCRLRGAGLPERLWFQVAPELAAALTPTGDAFVPPLLLASMERGARLIIEGEVSAALLRATPSIMAIFEQWSEVIDRPMRPVPVEAQARPRDVRGPAAGAFFSGGVDSFYTVLRNAARYPSADLRHITHLIVVHGFDIRLEDERLFAEVRDRLGEAARDLGKLLVLPKTNARAAVTQLPWEYAHGAAMAAVGLALARLFHTCYIAGSRSMRKPGPWGTHPGLDPLWSTETMEFVHDGALLGKMVKTPLVVTSPVALRVLRVCWENQGGAYNCGRCEKCLRTMLILALCGALGRVETLPAAVDSEAVARLRLPRSLIGLWQDLGRRLAVSGQHLELVCAVDRALAQSRQTPSPMGRAEAELLRALTWIGLIRPRIYALGQRFLRGRGTRGFSRLRGRN